MIRKVHEAGKVFAALVLILKEEEVENKRTPNSGSIYRGSGYRIYFFPDYLKKDKNYNV